MFKRLKNWLAERKEGAVDWEELEGILIQSDLGFSLTDNLIRNLRQHGVTAQSVGAALEKEFLALWPKPVRQPRFDARPSVWMIVGVNGVGKTTTLAKLAHYYQRCGKKVHLVAADTFRAAAIEQLAIWAGRLQCSFTSGQEGGDPAAAAFRGVEEGTKVSSDLVLIDTAGRLHNKEGLMRELEKIKRVLGKQNPDRPQEVLMIIDGTTGNNALSQAYEFHRFLGVTGLIVSKMDSTAKGGMIAALKREYDLETLFIGNGERLEDLRPFDPVSYAQAFRTNSLGPR